MSLVHREVDDEPGAAEPFARLDRHRAPVPFGDRPHHREPESGASGIATSTLLQAGEALEDSFPVGLGDPGPVVVDGESNGGRGSTGLGAEHHRTE